MLVSTVLCIDAHIGIYCIILRYQHKHAHVNAFISFIENSSLYDTVHHKVRSHVILIIILYNCGKPFSCDDKTV